MSEDLISINGSYSQSAIGNSHEKINTYPYWWSINNLVRIPILDWNYYYEYDYEYMMMVLIVILVNHLKSNLNKIMDYVPIEEH